MENTVKQQNIKKIAKIEEKLPQLIEEHNKLLLEKGAVACATLGGNIAELSNELVKCYKVVAFEELLAEENPLISAITKLNINIKRAQLTKAEGVNVRVYSLEDSELKIDIKEFEKYSKKQLTSNKDWHHAISKFNYLLLTYTIEKLTKSKELRESKVAKVRDNYHMKEIAKAIDLGQTPTSNTQMLKQLNMIIGDIIGKDYKIGGKAVKATSHDVFWLERVYLKKGKTALTAMATNDNQLRTIITEIIHKLLTNKEYEVISKYVK